VDLVGRTIGGYRLVAVLGRGGMGTVYRAEGGAGRPVAVKVLEKPEHGRLLERFRREAELLARVGGHPHIVGIHAAGQEGEHPYIVMELVEGGAVEPPVGDPHEAARIVEEVARAAAHLHGLGIVHRDIKPGNVLVGGDGRARLTDFGLARELARTTRLTGMGQVVGTPFYMAPEMLAGGDVEAGLGPASDVYALGALLFACLVGHPPFEARTLAELVSLVLHFPAPAPSRERSGVPRDLDAVVGRALAKDPRDRYPSALELALDLARFRRGESVTARPVSPLRLLARRARREPRRAALVVSACLLTLTAGPLARVGWLWLDARVARARVEERRARAAEEAKALGVGATAEARTALGELANGGDPARAASRARAWLRSIDAVSPIPAGEAGESLRAARARTLVVIGCAEHAAGDDEAARETLAAALAGSPDGDFRVAIAETAALAGDQVLAESALAGSDLDRPAGRRARAVVLVAARKYREALALLGSDAPSDPELLAVHASALLGAGDAEGCLAALKNAARSRTAGARERRLEARAHAARGEEIEAARAFEQAVLLAPRDAGLALEEARWFVSRGEPERARASVAGVRSRAPVASDLVSARASLLQGDTAAATAAVESACAFPGRERREALLLRSRIARGLGAPAETWARAALDLSIHDDERAEAALELGRAALAAWAADHAAAPTPFARAGKAGPDPALSRARSAFEIATTSPATAALGRAGLARIAIAKGEVERAGPLLESSADDDGDLVADLLLARAERALAANDGPALEAVRVRSRTLRLAEEATPIAPALVAWPRPDETLELARALEESALRLLASAARTRNAVDLHRASDELGVAVALAPTARRLALLARARLLGGRPGEACRLGWQAALVDPGAAGAACVFLEAALEADEGLDPALEASVAPGFGLATTARDAFGPDETVALSVLRARVFLRERDLGAARRELEQAAKARPLPAVLRALASAERRAGDGSSAAIHEETARSLEKELALLAPRQETFAHDPTLPSDKGEALTNRRVELEPYRARTYQARSAYRLMSWDVPGALLDWARNSALEGGAALEFLDWIFREKERTGTPAFDPSKVRDRIARDEADRVLRAYASGLAELLGYETGITDDDPSRRVSGSLRLAEAARCFDRVLALEPAAHCALVFRARAFQRLGRRDAARADLEKSLDLGSDPEALARYFLATLAAREGDVDEAVKQLVQTRGWQNVRLRAQQDPDLRVLREKSPEFVEWLKQP
jgi:hypothetical protein